jgi:pyruvate dehydrogenase E2 component (dihydrolipoamide acetyltransferase)
VETDKGIIDIEVYEDGTIDRILVDPDTRVRVGAVLATYHREGELPDSVVPDRQSRGEPVASPASAAVENAGILVPEASSMDEGRKRVSPAARKHVLELGVDVAKISGTGPHGAVTVEDVDAAAKAVATVARSGGESQAVSVEPVGGMRRVIAAAMSRSKREIPHYYLSTTIDMTRALAWLETFNQGRPVGDRVLYAVLLLKATAKALRKAPELNGLWVNDSFHQSQTCHVSVAISLRSGGLVLPVLQDVDTKSLPELMRDFDDLVTRARTGHLRASELQDSTITVTSLGEQGVETVYPIIYPPQVAIVGFGSIVERAWAIDGMLAARHVITATLAADHRASDGHRGGLFLAALNKSLQEPEAL